MANVKHCQTCRFWDCTPTHINPLSVKTERIYGFCRKTSPKFISGGLSAGHGIWPITSREEWCGEWVRKEKK